MTDNSSQVSSKQRVPLTLLWAVDDHPEHVIPVKGIKAMDKIVLKTNSRRGPVGDHSGTDGIGELKTKCHAAAAVGWK